MKYTTNAVIFDFDGVLINSVQDIAHAVNATLVQFGAKPIAEKQIANFIGDGARNLLLRSLNASSFAQNDANKLNAMLDWFTNYYKENPANYTTLYDYALEVMESLYVMGIRMALVSNKPLCITHAILDYFDLSDFFDAIIGPEMLKSIKPDPEGIVLAMQEINAHRSSIDKIEPKQVIMVGDSAVDVLAGKAFGAVTCGITSGIGNVSALLCANPDIKITTLRSLLDYIA